MFCARIITRCWCTIRPLITSLPLSARATLQLRWPSPSTRTISWLEMTIRRWPALRSECFAGPWRPLCSRSATIPGRSRSSGNAFWQPPRGRAHSYDRSIDLNSLTASAASQPRRPTRTPSTSPPCWCPRRTEPHHGRHGRRPCAAIPRQCGHFHCLPAGFKALKGSIAASSFSSYMVDHYLLDESLVARA